METRTAQLEVCAALRHVTMDMKVHNNIVRCMVINRLNVRSLNPSIVKIHDRVSANYTNGLMEGCVYEHAVLVSVPGVDARVSWRV